MYLGVFLCVVMCIYAKNSLSTFSGFQVASLENDHTKNRSHIFPKVSKKEKKKKKKKILIYRAAKGIL